MHTVYKITNKLDSKCYIGLTKQTLSARWHQHCNCKKRIQYINKALDKHLATNFSIIELGYYEDLTSANNAEIYFIEYFNCLAPNGYNLHTGGASHQVSEITRQKMSIAKKGKSSNSKGHISKFKGKKSTTKPAYKEIICVETGKNYPSLKAAAIELKLNYQKISNVLTGHRKHTGGLSFIYKEDQ